jgi:hypothetical protein
MLEDPRFVVTIIIIALVAIIPGWLIRIWLNRIELRRTVERIAAQAKKEERKQ